MQVCHLNTINVCANISIGINVNVVSSISIHNINIGISTNVDIDILQPTLNIASVSHRSG